ncbi:ABC transporter ATP-binding/permease protein [Candidatus Bealeia paramacronuclearis]|uniref:ABC transporter ATP-binding/permease protein n=1 Tax=Candidatus Bealeia paramacronuclearis TaxID=1921001 RepID=A0ABZ2C1D2_9PROT|nr:ABC transporter ATP-binding/permease protein [Candidatus Bealeia paramacronuclearis]
MLREPSYAEENQLPSRARAPIQSLKKLTPFLKPYPKIMILSFTSICVAAGSVIAVGSALKYLVDFGFKNNGSSLLTWAILVLFLVIIVMACASYMRLYYVSNLAEHLVADIRKAVFTHLIKQDVNFFESTRLGEIQSRLTTDTTLLQIVMGTSIPVAIRNILIIIFGIGMLMTTSLLLSVVILVLIPVVLIPIILYGKKVRKFSRKTQEETAEISIRLDETFGFIRTVFAYCREKYMAISFSEHVTRAYDASMERVQARALLTAFVMILVFSGVSVVLWIGGQKVITGEMSAGALSAFVFYAVAVAGASGSLSEIHGDLLRAAGGCDRIIEFLNLKSEIQSPSTPAPFPSPLRGEIKFERITFTYPARPDKMVLEDFSLDIASGETVAVVGLSGAGKSTLISLILRFYDPKFGRVTLDGVDIRSLNLDDLRRPMGYVSQDPILFSTTISENIRFGDLNATQDDIRKAAEAAYALEFIESMPQGFETFVGEKGVQLSGGQRQRIAVARAILRNPRILLLDEATSALDTESEGHVQNALTKLMEGRTTLMIAHRLSTIRHAHRIIVLDQGRIVAEGPHDQLMAQEGLYQRLASIQFQYDEKP